MAHDCIELAYNTYSDHIDFITMINFSEWCVMII